MKLGISYQKINPILNRNWFKPEFRSPAVCSVMFGLGLVWHGVNMSHNFAKILRVRSERGFGFYAPTIFCYGIVAVRFVSGFWFTLWFDCRHGCSLTSWVGRLFLFEYFNAKLSQQVMLSFLLVPILEEKMFFFALLWAFFWQS